MIVAELFSTLGLIPDKDSFDVGHELIESLHKAIDAYFSYEALKGVIEMFEGVAEAADHAAKAAQRTGIAVETFQELGHAASMSDTDIGTVASGMDRLELGLQRFARTGKGPVGDALHKLHVSLTSLRHATPEQRLELLADAFAKLPAGAEKTAAAIQLFGGAGRSMIPLLNSGAAGIRDMRDEAYDLGLVIDEDVTHKFEEFNDQQTRISKWFQGFRNQIAVALLPVLSDLVDRFYEWLQANREWIEEGVDAILNGVISSFTWLAHTLSDGIDLLKKHKEYLVALGLVIAGIIVPAVVSWAAATVVAMAPWIALGGAVALVAYWIKEIFDESDEGYTMANVWEAAKMAAEDFGDWLSQLPENASRWIKDVGESIKKTMKDAWDAAVKVAKDAWEAIKQIPVIGHILKGVEWAANGVKGIIDHDLQGMRADRISAEQSKKDVDDSLKRLREAEERGAKIEAEARRLGAAADNNFRGGDVHVTVHAASMTPEQVEKHVVGAVREANADAIRQAHAALGGGKRQ